MWKNLYTRFMTFLRILAVVLAFIAGNLTYILWSSEGQLRWVTFGPTAKQDVIWACYVADGVRTMYCADLQTVVDSLQQQNYHEESL